MLPLGLAKYLALQQKVCKSAWGGPLTAIIRAASRPEHRSRNRQISADMGTAGLAFTVKALGAIVVDLHKAAEPSSALVHPIRRLQTSAFLKMRSQVGRRKQQTSMEQIAAVADQFGQFDN